MVKAIASHHFSPGSISGPGFTCGLSLLLFLVLDSRVVSTGPSLFLSQKLTFQIPIRPGNIEQEETPSWMSTAKFPLISLFILFPI